MILTGASPLHCSIDVLWRCGSVEYYDIDGICLLLAATVQLAIRDAKRGDKAAQRWLRRFLDGVKC